MSNIQKAFKTKSKLRAMADGGPVRPSPEMLGSGMAQRAGSMLQGRRAQIDAAIDAASGTPPPPRPAPTVPVTAAPAKKPEEKSALRSFFGLADGGSPADDMAPPETELADGGKVKGKGGPTDDKVGPVMLSNGEYVLPADTVEIVGRENLDALRLATHDFVDDGNKPKVSGLRKMANGGTFYVDPEGVASRQLPPGRAVIPYQPAAPAEPARPSVGSQLRSAAGNAVRTGGALLATGLEAKNVYDAYQSGGVDAAAPEAAMGATRLASATLGARAGAALPLPGWGKPVAAAVGGAAGYMAPNAVANSEYMQKKGRESALRDAFMSRFDKELAPTFDPRANTITTSDGRMFGSGRLNSNPHLQYQGYLTAKADQAIASKAPLMNPTTAEMEALGAYRSREASTAKPTDSAIGASQLRPGELPGMRNVPAGVRTSSAGMPTTPVQPQSYQSHRLAEMGVPIDQQNLPPVTEDTRRSLLRKGGGTPGQYVNLGSYGGDTNIYGTASKPGGRIDTFVGVGTPARPGSGPQEDPIMGEIRSALRSLTDSSGNRGGAVGAVIGSDNTREVNERFDKLASELRGMYGPKGQGNLARRLLELEQARSAALDADARNQSTLRGQDMQASTAANNASMQARMQALQTLGTMANQRNTQLAQAQADMLKALQDAQKAGIEREEKGFERYTGAIANMFIGPDGKPDAAEQERFTSFLQASDPQAREKFTAMSPQDQMVLLQNFKTLYDMQKARNATAERGGGAITNRVDMPVDVREATWNDYWNNNLPLADYLWSNIPFFTNRNVVVTESGQPVLMSDYATTNGEWDADKLELIRQRTGKDREGRSALRGN